MESEKLGIVIKKINTTFQTIINNVLKKYDITKVQCDVLMYLSRNEGKQISQRDIEKYFSISNPTVSGILDRLESKALIERIVSQKDARYKYIVLTDKARALVKKLKCQLGKNEQQLMADLTKEEEETLRYLLDRILRNISK